MQLLLRAHLLKVHSLCLLCSHHLCCQKPQGRVHQGKEAKSEAASTAKAAQPENCSPCRGLEQGSCCVKPYLMILVSG